ncbi:hypothetical protein VOI54_03220 [Tamlana sp. 2201CG12-4]|uniref:hypothetical protein n=1 Tax=Tamlana sp. 2201CG12-4 TaxID=3112582 RepID=UPI002DBD568B|nr:hypothetical protein [Tamlana sp. 2201CG12-4]MEC3906011.1 hypothetical protein [Tamlana sp. 2201CG12-4]
MIIDVLNEFKGLKKNGIYSISNIKHWILKYNGYHKSLSANWFCSNTGCRYKQTRQCHCSNKHEAYIFLELYKALSDFSKYHKREEYARCELNTYTEIKTNADLLKNWVRKNEPIGTKECFEFLLCHYDYTLNPTHLLVMGNSLLGYEVFVDSKDFKNLIAFMDIFSELFWVKRLYPESDILNV